MANAEYKDFGRALCAAEFPKLKGIEQMGFTTIDLNPERTAERKKLSEERIAQLNKEMTDEQYETGRQRFLNAIGFKSFWLKYGDVVSCLIVLAIAAGVFFWMLTGGLY